MKKNIITVFLFIFIPVYSFGIEEVVLDKSESTHINLDYLSDVYYGRIEDNNAVSPVLKLFSKDGLKFENSRINSVKAVFVFGNELNYEHKRSSGQSFKSRFSTVEPMIFVKFNDNKSAFMFDYNLTRDLDGYSNDFTQKISQLYVSHEITPNQKILLGQGSRLPSSYDGSRSMMEQDMVLKAQLGRTFGNRRSMGIRNIASYKYLDYDIGIYDSTQYMKNFGNGADFTGFVMLKPFGINDESKTNFRFGAGYSNGHNNISYNMYSFFAAYDCKKFHIKAEYADSDGYNSIKEAQNKAEGFYTSISYDITPKFTVSGRFDNFIADKHNKNAYTNEYSLGMTYHFFMNLKFMLNYVKRAGSNSPESDMILFATRFII